METTGKRFWRYKYLTFAEGLQTGKTKKFSCVNTNSGFELGAVRWHGAWRQYCFFPTVGADMVFSAGCLKDIADFLTTVTKQHREL